MRTPFFDGTAARFTGILRLPVLNVTPPANAIAIPPALRFGPTANSTPLIDHAPASQLKLGSTVP